MSRKLIARIYLLVGFFPPWVVIFMAALWYHRFDEIVEFPSHLLGGGYNYFFAARLNLIPFAIAATLMFVQSKKPSTARTFGVAVGASFVLVLNVFCQGEAWLNLIGPHPDSLTGLAIFYCPWLATAALFASGLLASFLAALALQFKRPR